MPRSEEQYLADEHWSLPALKEYVESLFKAHEQRHEDMESHRIELRDLLRDTLSVIAEALKEYKESANEWRALVNNAIADRPDKKELAALAAKFETSHETLVVLVGSFAEKLTDAITKINQERWIQAGAKEQGGDTQKTVFALIGALGVVVSVVLAIVLVIQQIH